MLIFTLAVLLLFGITFTRYANQRWGRIARDTAGFGTFALIVVAFMYLRDRL